MIEQLIISTLIAHAVAWSFPWVQQLKSRAGVSGTDFEELCEMDDHDAQHQRRRTILQAIRFKLAKALGCEACMGFWSCAVLAVSYYGWHTLAIAPLAYTLSAVLARILSEK